MIAALWVCTFLAAENTGSAPPGGTTELLAQVFWLAAGLGALLGILVLIKKLREGGAKLNPQPFLVAMEKEFVHRHEYERRNTDLENQVKEGRSYSHDEVHAVRNELHAMKLSGEQRDEVLHKLDERTLTHVRQLTGLDQKLDKVVERMGDKVEQLLRDRGPSK